MSPSLSESLLEFVQQSPTPFHAVKSMSQRLLAADFTQLHEKDAWQQPKPGRYFVTRSDASIAAFIVGTEAVTQQGIRIVGAHTDSPCLKVKPKPVLRRHGYFQLGIEVYGGALLNPWFDRDLSLAGKVLGMQADGQLISALIDFERPIATVPSLAIHLDREANNCRNVNAQTHLNAIVSHGTDDSFEFTDMLLRQVVEQHPDCDMHKVLDFNLSFYDTQAPALVGYNQEFVASARLDNLLSCYVGLRALLDSDASHSAVLICNDHEEVGSCTESGAGGSMLEDLLARLIPDTLSRQRVLRQSLMLSVDNAHGIHPNYPDKHDAAHSPELNGGAVIKFNAGQSYATNSDTAAVVRILAQGAGEGLPSLPLQDFAMRADMRCGSTIGPLTSAKLGVKTVDVGAATFAMHSIRELAGRKDVQNLYTLLQRFNQSSNIWG